MMPDFWLGYVCGVLSAIGGVVVRFLLNRL